MMYSTMALSSRMTTPVEKKLHNSEETEVVPSTPQVTVSTATMKIHENKQDMMPPESEDPGSSEKTEKSSRTDSQNEQSEVVTEFYNEKHSNSVESRSSKETTDIEKLSYKMCAHTVEPVSEKSPIVQNSMDNDSSDSREITKTSQESDQTPEAHHGETAERGEGIVTESVEGDDAIQVTVKTGEDESKKFSVTEKTENNISNTESKNVEEACMFDSMNMSDFDSVEKVVEKASAWLDLDVKKSLALQRALERPDVFNILLVKPRNTWIAHENLKSSPDLLDSLAFWKSTIQPDCSVPRDCFEDLQRIAFQFERYTDVFQCQKDILKVSPYLFGAGDFVIQLGFCDPCHSLTVYADTYFIIKYSPTEFEIFKIQFFDL